MANIENEDVKVVGGSLEYNDPPVDVYIESENAEVAVLENSPINVYVQLPNVEVAVGDNYLVNDKDVCSESPNQEIADDPLVQDEDTSPESSNRESLVNDDSSTNDDPNNVTSVIDNSSGKKQNSLSSQTSQVDRYGFIVSHHLHSKVSSLPNTAVPVNIGKKRENKWLVMIESWSQIIKKKNNKVKVRSRKGIPQSVRSLAWQYLSGANVLRDQNPGVYRTLINQERTESDWSYTISKDIPRTFRHHSMFYDNNSQGQEDLFNVLYAFSSYDTETGYNQALAPVSAVLLMHMPPEESFWVLVSICRYYLPGYYGEKMEAMRLDGLIFGELLSLINLPVAMHMRKHNIDPLMYIVEWMVCIYARCLPFETVLRIWDMFFCEGVKVLFKIGLSILKVVFPTEKELEGKDDYQTTRLLGEIPKECALENVLIPEVLKLTISEKQFEKAHRKVLRDNPELGVRRFRGGSHTLPE